MTGTDNSQHQQQRYPCPVCGNTFTRPQHVVRHLRSHTGERPYKCKECGDAFARSDLLSRHVNKCHPALANSGPPQNGKLPKRRACEHCAHTGSRCDSNSPCSSCVEQGVPCSRMPKAISSHQHQHHLPQHHHIPPPLPGFSESRSGLLPSLGSSIPPLNTSHHRRNLSDASASDWSSDSARSRSSQYSQSGITGYGAAGFDSSTSSLDNLGGALSLRGSGGMSTSSSSSGLPLPWVPSSTLGNSNPLDQSTMTPSQVRAMYGGSLPAGYAHPSQYSASQLPAPPGSLSLPNPNSLPSLSGTQVSSLPGTMDPYHSYAPLVGTYGHDNAKTSLPSGSSIGYAQRRVPSIGSGANHDRSRPYDRHPSSSLRSNVSGIGQQSSSLTPAPAWKDYGPPQGTTVGNSYNYDPMSDFTPQSVSGISQAAYSLQQQGAGSDEGHHSNPSPPHASFHAPGSSPPNAGDNGGSARPSLPGLDSFVSATFPPLNLNISGTPSSTNSSSTVVGSSSNANPSNITTAPGMAYLYGRGADRRGSIASSGSAVSDSVSTPSSLVFQGPPSPGDMSVTSSSRPNTSSGSIVGGYAPPGLPSAFGGLQLRAGGGGGGDEHVTSGDAAGDNAGNPSAGGAGDVDNRKYRQLWSSWIATPFSSASEKDGYPLPNTNNAPTPVGHAPGANSVMSAVPSHLQSSSSKQGHGQMDHMQHQQGQNPYGLQKSMSLPAIRTPNSERRSMTGADLATPRVHGNQAYNLANAEELRQYEEACRARETPLTLAPPRPRNASNATNSLTPPITATHAGSDGDTDDHASNSPSPGSMGTGSSGSVGGHNLNTLYVPSNGMMRSSSRPGSSHSIGTSTSGGSGRSVSLNNSGAMWQLQYANDGTAMSVPEPEPHVAKSNMNLSGQLGGGQYTSGASRPRPSWKRLASQTIGPDLIKSARVDDDGDDGDVEEGGFEIPRPPSIGHRKRSNSSPTSSSTSSRQTQGGLYGGGSSSNIVGFHPLPSGSPYPGAHSTHATMAHN